MNQLANKLKLKKKKTSKKGQPKILVVHCYQVHIVGNGDF